MSMPWQPVLQWTVVGLLGWAVGTAELVSRYRDAPGAAIRTWAAMLYVAIKILASLGAYGLAKVLNLDLGAGNGRDPSGWGLAVLSGISAMAIFRSSLFVRRIGVKDVGVGPSSFLQIFLNAADAEVDRQRAVLRGSAVNRITAGLDYRKTFAALPPYCLALMQNLSDDAQRDLAKALDLLDKDAMPNELKVAVLGLELVNVVGVAVLEQAVHSLGDRIKA
jgi:hypothetical protein